MLRHPTKPKMRPHVYSLGFATKAPFQLLLQSWEGFLGTWKGIIPDLARIMLPLYSYRRRKYAIVCQSFPPVHYILTSFESLPGMH